MKKKNLIAISAATLLSACALVGCAGDSYASMTFPAQDTSYAVTSQGGSAVSYGNYVYFINGYRGYEDTDGRNNLYGDVVKGGLYRAELNGTKNAAEPFATFTTTFDNDKQLEFKSTPSTDYDGNAIDVVDVTAIANKTIGTSGYDKGGVFIYDNYVFFASPYNQQDNLGNVLSSRTDFYAMRLNGGRPIRIYTSSADTASAPYSFYMYGGNVYLTVFESPNVYSIKVNLKSFKAESPVLVSENATSVYFPVRDTYYSGIDNNTLADYIYFVRAVSPELDEFQRVGTVIEAARPDGSENFLVVSSNNTLTIERADENMLFYRDAISSSSSTQTTLRYTNMHDQLLDYSPTYKASQDAKDAASKSKLIEGEFTRRVDNFTSTYAFSSANSNVQYLLASSSTAFELISTASATNTSKVLGAGSMTINYMSGNYVFYNDGTDYYRINPFIDDTAETLVSTPTATGYTTDYCNGYYVYTKTLDQWADNYTFFKLIDRREGVEEKFVGIRAEADVYDPDAEDEEEESAT